MPPHSPNDPLAASPTPGPTPNPGGPHAIADPLPSPFEADPPPTDPGSPNSRILALFAAILFASLAIVWQHLPEGVQFQAVGQTAPAEPDERLLVDPMTPVSMYGRMAVKLNSFMGSNPQATSGPNQMAQFTDAMELNAFTFEDRLATAATLGEIEGVEAAQQYLENLDIEIQLALTQPAKDNPALTEFDLNAYSTQEALDQDLRAFETIYANGSAALADDAAERLRIRYGYFAEVALTHDADETTEAYRTLRSGGLGIMLGLLAVGALVVVAFLAGLVLLVFGLIRFLPGAFGREPIDPNAIVSHDPRRWAFEPPAVGGSVMLETYVLFVAGFLAVSVAGVVLIATKPELAIYTLPVQFSLMAVVLWPLLRGMSFGEWRAAVGLTAPRGVLREIGFGMIAYLASVPLFLLGVGVSLVLVFARELIRMGGTPTGPVPPPENPILDFVAGGWGMILIFALLATIWAPITEELIFRGALYRHMRGRLHWVVAALFSAVLFAAMHGYEIIMLTPLVVLGFMFAVMREIRGSVIAAIVAHFIHNFTLLLIMAFVLRPLLV